MLIIPAIDILDGRIVRLKKGNYDEVTHYSVIPSDIVSFFSKFGFEWIHIVDLKAACTGNTMLVNTLPTLIDQKNIKIQFGGGIRSIAKAKKLLKLGIDRIIFSTMIFKSSSFYFDLTKEINNKNIVLSLDILNFRCYINGWTEKSDHSVYTILDRLNNLKTVIVTDINSDGMMKKDVNYKLYSSITSRYPHLHVIAAGGIASIEVIKKLQKIGCHGVIIGRALYENPTLLKDIKENYE